MKVIGITGGIGSGKSLITQLLKEKYGAYLLNTDQIAKELMEQGEIGYVEVIQTFGNHILMEDGTIDRNKLAQIVFQDKSKLLKLNELIHPKVLIAVKEEIQNQKLIGAFPYLLIETALMIESGYDYVCDEVWYVYASQADRRKRLKINRNYSDEKIDLVFNSQSKSEEFRKKFPKVIDNTGDITQLEKQVEQLMFQL